jgi:hypothetical protein
MRRITMSEHKTKRISNMLRRNDAIEKAARELKVMKTEAGSGRSHNFRLELGEYSITPSKEMILAILDAREQELEQKYNALDAAFGLMLGAITVDDDEAV